MSDNNNDEMKHALRQAEKKGRRKGWFARIRSFLVGILCGMLILTLFTAHMHGLAIKDTFKALFTTETAVEDHDLTLINHRIFGYKVADFADAVLGDKERLKKLEVYSREVSDVSTLTQAGLFKLKAFSKYLYITYNGKAVYTVDLSGLTADDITLFVILGLVEPYNPFVQVDIFLFYAKRFIDTRAAAIKDAENHGIL